MLDLFSMSDLGLLSYYLGIEVKQSGEGIKLSQTSYASKILEKTGMLKSNAREAPMEQRLKLNKCGEGEKVDAPYYRRSKRLWHFHLVRQSILQRQQLLVKVFGWLVCLER
jgi:hypothetical protein